ncbi:MAG TPA: hypothetical protein VHV83_19945 [Armatimonadota bacterium]|nr:hypothetical protein [Armatimonadota bacterium]
METHALSENSRSQSRIELYRVRVYQLLHKSDRHDVLGLAIDGGITGLIILNVIAVILGTEHYFAINYARFLKNFEILSIVIFTIEYLLRVWCSTVEKRYRHRVSTRHIVSMAHKRNERQQQHTDEAEYLTHSNTSVTCDSGKYSLLY